MVVLKQPSEVRRQLVVFAVPIDEIVSSTVASRGLVPGATTIGTIATLAGGR